MAQRRILLIVSGGIAAYKSLELIRRLREHAIDVRCVLTEGGAQFVTPLSLAALSENPVHTDLFSLTDETEMGHIQLSRQADLLVVAPASADLLAKMANGFANDLATTVLLATDKPILVAPAMNVRMWNNPATQANIGTLQNRGIGIIGPEEGPMACGEYGPGRLSTTEEILKAILGHLDATPKTVMESKQPLLSGVSVLVTSGPTHEPIDPVRYIANRSSGKQGHAIAAALVDQGATVTLVSGPTHQPTPVGVKYVPVETAHEMMEACQDSMPVDVAVFAAAVADWRVENKPNQKIKKKEGAAPPTLTMTLNPDILQTISTLKSGRPKLVIGFAAETEKVVDQAKEKRRCKGCDWILANDVSPATGTFGGDHNKIHFINHNDVVETWPMASKASIAAKLSDQIKTYFASDMAGETE